jgi:choline dehydrogenase-like flavoprotein
MIDQITLEDAQSRQWDVVVAGSSFAAMFFVHGLPKNLSVLVVEKGLVQEHDAQLMGGIAGLTGFAQTNDSPNEKHWVAHTVFGGNSNCWWACTPRFHPSDFQMKSLYGQGEDWPISYDELEPFYEEVETLMEICGGGSDHILPRKMPFPYPPHIGSRTDMLLRDHSRDWFAQPAARSNGGSRATCCANGVCHVCPIDAKFTIPNGVDAVAGPNVSFVTGAELREVMIEAGAATGAVVQAGSQSVTIRADIVALGTNAIFNAAIMLRSGLTHPWLGRGLGEQTSVEVKVDAKGFGLFGGTSITGHGYPLYDGAHRSEHSGTLIEVYNAPAELRPEFGRWMDRANLKLIVEDIPQQHNTVTLKDSEPVLTWKGYSDYALKGIEHAVASLPDILPVEIEDLHVSELVKTEAHIMCTHRMGADPAKFVTDHDLSVHGVSGLYALGAGNFPTQSMANPTLTLSSLSLRAGRALA